MKGLRALTDKLNKLDLLLCELLFVLMFVSALAQVLCRFIFNTSLGFSDELCRYAMIYIVFLAIPLSLRQGRMLRLEAFIDPWLYRGDRAGRGRRQAYQAFTCILVGGFYLLAAISALLMMRVNSSQLSPALDLPMSIPYSAILLGGLLTVVNCLAVFDQPPSPPGADGAASGGEAS